MTIGWFRSAGVSHPGRLFLGLSGSETVEACTGSEFRLERRSVPEDYDVGEGMRYEFCPASPDHPVATLIGTQLTAVRRLMWRDWNAGIVVTAGALQALIADQADEVFVSAGVLPADYEDAILVDT
ncbi:MAG: hypothetical protein ACE367_26405 [Acidimicrobiales bacterium]